MQVEPLLEANKKKTEEKSSVFINVFLLRLIEPRFLFPCAVPPALW